MKNVSERKVTLFHAPNTRSAGVRILLEEIHADYDIHVLNLKAGEQRSAAYLAVNPMGKVPAIKHGDAIVTEQVAVFIYLADLYADAGLAPQIGDPLRGPYLRWLAFYGSCFEPALIDRALKRDPAPPSTSPYGDYDMTMNTLTDQLGRGQCILGDTYSAADILWGTALTWTTSFGLVPKLPAITAYIERASARPAAKRVKTMDAELASSFS